MSDSFETKAIRYLDNSMSHGERDAFVQELAEDKTRQEEFFQLKDTWESLEIPSFPDIDKEWRKLDGKLKDQNLVHGNTTRRILLMAAASAAILVLGIFIGQIQSIFQNETTEMVSVSVPFGSRSSVDLPDGSTIVLNSGSSLKYPVSFNVDNRVVELSGEGYFYVARNEKSAFHVLTREFNITVLGTEFNVSAYNDYGEVTTSLVSGKLKIITNGKSETILLPGQKITYSRSSGEYTVAYADMDHEVLWKENILSFKDETIDQLARKLEKWYNVRIVFEKDSMTEEKFSGRFKNHETILQALDAIKATSNIDYRSTGFREFTLISK